ASIERVLHEQPGLADAVVVAVPDERWGEVPVAVTASRDADLDAATAAVAAALGAPARPARMLTVPALPLLPSGKVDRLAVRATALALLNEGDSGVRPTP